MPQGRRAGPKECLLARAEHLSNGAEGAGLRSSVQSQHLGFTPRERNE